MKRRDYIVLRRRSDNTLLFWEVPHRRAPKRILNLVEGLRAGRVELAGSVLNVGSLEEAIDQYRNYLAIEAKPIVPVLIEGVTTN